jgi:hypothetical protein
MTAGHCVLLQEEEEEVLAEMRCPYLSLTMTGYHQVPFCFVTLLTGRFI